LPAGISTASLSTSLAQELAQASRLRWRLQGLHGGAAAYVLAALLADADFPSLILVADHRQAEELASELQTLGGERPESALLERRVHLLPTRETPYLEMVSPSFESEGARLAALYQLSQSRAPIVVSCPEAVRIRTITPASLLDASPYLVVGDELDLDRFSQHLLDAGYRKGGVVEDVGETAVRGGIIDIWPPGYDSPCRIELLGDAIESIRQFDAADQKSFGALEEVLVLPTVPFSLARLGETAIRTTVNRRCDDLGLPTSERRALDDSLASGRRFPGVELLAPYATGETAWVGDYLPAQALTVIVDPPAVETALESTDAELADALAAATEAGTFFPEVGASFVPVEEARSLTTRERVVELDAAEALESSGEVGHRIWRLETRGNGGVASARARLRASKAASGFRPMAEALLALKQDGSRLILTASDPAQLRRLEHLLRLNGVEEVAHAGDFPSALASDPAPVWLLEGHLERGFSLPADRIAVVTDEEIFGERRRSRRRRRLSTARAMSILGHLQAGDYMVHVDHGIGVYRGLKHLTAGGTEGDFLHLEYAGGDRYYLPVDRINLVEKYVGAGGGEPPRLDRLGSASWAKTKRRAKELILEMARELLDVEAFRSVHRRPAYAEADDGYEEFEAHFPFEETEGQRDAIAAVVGDLTGDKPMDRLVCGDVGYGKTEVAMRAAYLAALGGKQVAVLVPTTVLARQHYDTFRRRFDGYPIRVAMLSRFQSALENAAVVTELKAGKVDIVVGTHRLLQRDVSFAALGLLVVDEEHRFGVKAKERIKQMRRSVDVLTLTATPIPRTLQLALGGVRDLSLIETPPVDRLAIRTYVARYDEGLVKQAILREIGRGGQVFYVHNRVSSIAAVAHRLRELVPGARIAVGHGQMRESELEKVMVDFLEDRADVLVCTSIIESGLDIPNANTMVVNRADTFGLAQLYQIRGRVGRSHRRAYAYLLVPSERAITEEARRRLAALQELDDLGGGFRLAAHDLEIRGAGNVLGKQQSGQVTAVGFDLFMRMLEEATQEVRGLEPGPHVEPEIELGAHAFIPESYIEDVGERLLVYKRMANVREPVDLGAICEELDDRFGPLPQPARDFARIMALRPDLKRLAVDQLKGDGKTVAMRFHEGSPVDTNQLVRLATDDPDRYRLRPGQVFTYRPRAASWDGMIDEIVELLSLLTDTAHAGRVPGGNDDGASLPYA